MLLLSFDELRACVRGGVVHPYTQEIFAETDLLPLIDRLWDLRRRGVGFLTDTDGDDSLVLGGDPLLPMAMQWPVDDDGHDLAFIGEVDLSTFEAIAPLNITDGFLLFFQNLTISNQIQFKSSGRCVHIESHFERRVRPHPDGMFEDGRARVSSTGKAIPVDQLAQPLTPKRRLGARTGWWLPHPSGSAAATLGAGDRVALEAIDHQIFQLERREGRFTHAHLLGWAEGTQAPIEDHLDSGEPGASWRSLFCFHDTGGGASQWFARERDLNAGDVSRTFFEWDCG